jgi:hypothetical protein
MFVMYVLCSVLLTAISLLGPLLVLAMHIPWLPREYRR